MITLPHYIYHQSLSESGRSQTLVLFHGTGGDEHDLIPITQELGGSYNILSLRGTVSEGGMNRFFKRLSIGVLDEQDLRQKTEELVGQLRLIADKEGFNYENMIALGYSNGANMIASVLVMYPTLFAAAILYRPMRPFVDIDPIVIHTPKPVLIISGTRDSITSLDNVQGFVGVLQQMGYDVDFRPIEAQHGFTHQDVIIAREWIEKAITDLYRV